jgi:hypothetical protein
LRFSDREIPEKQGVDQCEYGGIRADSQRKREYLDSGENPIPAQHADCVTEVLHDGPQDNLFRTSRSTDQFHFYAGKSDLSSLFRPTVIQSESEQLMGLRSP